MLALLETCSGSKSVPLFENSAAFNITKCSFLNNISTCVFNYYFENYRFLSTPNHRAITHPCLFDWLICMIVLTKAELIWQVYKTKLSKTASNFEFLHSKLWLARAKVVNACKLCSYMCGYLTWENKLFCTTWKLEVRLMPLGSTVPQNFSSKFYRVIEDYLELLFDD